MNRQTVLIDVTDYLPTEGTITGAIAETEAEQAAAETENGARIRAMITAELPDGAAGRWAATLDADTDAGAGPDERPESVDVNALGLTAKQRALLLDLDSPWHHQTRKGAYDKGLITDIKATALTELGARVRAALIR